MGFKKNAGIATEAKSEEGGFELLGGDLFVPNDSDYGYRSSKAYHQLAMDLQVFFFSIFLHRVL